MAHFISLCYIKVGRKNIKITLLSFRNILPGLNVRLFELNIIIIGPSNEIKQKIKFDYHFTIFL